MHFSTLLIASLVGIAVSQSSSAAPTPAGIEIITVTIPDGAGPTPPTGGNSPDGGNITDTTGDPLGVGCSGWTMPNDQFASINAAKAYMEWWCHEHPGPVIGPRSGIIFRSKNAQVYYCNYAVGSQEKYNVSCNIAEYNLGEPFLDGNCGKGGGGWMNYRWKDRSWYSVGRDPRYDGFGNQKIECGF